VTRFTFTSVVWAEHHRHEAAELVAEGQRDPRVGSTARSMIGRIRSRLTDPPARLVDEAMAMLEVRGHFVQVLGSRSHEDLSSASGYPLARIVATAA
jgi:hypothetical protein